MTTLICQNEKRRKEVRKKPRLLGLDYLEVGNIDAIGTSLNEQRVLRVYFLGKADVDLDKSNIIIEGGRRIRDIKVQDVQIHHHQTAELDDYMLVTVDKAGDFSTYMLKVVKKIQGDEPGTYDWVRHAQFDSRYDRIEFNFKADCPSDLDCKQEAICPPEVLPEPDINYLAKDYASFRKLIFDRMALTMPNWKERHAPDIGVTLVELLAYVGDHLSYYQDAVATEAYLDTARKRKSVRRHARLVDYVMHEGCNARAWLCLQTEQDQPLKLEEIFFITGSDDRLPAGGNILSTDDLRQLQIDSYEVFEPVKSDDRNIQLYKSHNVIKFYTWGDSECCLAKGATSATLAGELIIGEEAPEENPCPEEPVQENGKEAQYDNAEQQGIDDQQNNGSDEQLPKLHLKPGDVLIFEEVKGPQTGHPDDANPKHRHVVRLTQVEAAIDQLEDKPVVEVRWAVEDALPFPLCISALGPAPKCKMIEDISVACGNVILVDHGQRLEDEPLGKVPKKETIKCCKAEGLVGNSIIVPAIYGPKLQHGPLTYRQPVNHLLPASKMLQQDVRKAIPQIKLTSCDEQKVKTNKEKTDKQWEPRQDLLASGPDDCHFVVELNDEGIAQLRFGNDELGEQPDAGLSFKANYRVGIGSVGNVGANAISHIISRVTLSGKKISVRNPMAAQGGVDPEAMSEVKLFAPHTFRKDLQRAITADDYAAIVERDFKGQIQRAAAKLRWTGSGYQVLIAVDPYGQDQANPDLLNAISAHLHQFRRIGHDFVVKSAQRVALDIELLICVSPAYLRGHVKAELLDILSNRILINGDLGFFHPDNLTFGEGIHLSRLVAIVQSIAGVDSVQVKKLQRLFEPPNQEIENGILPLGPFEIARLDNDPSLPENGKLTLTMGGGR